MNALHSDSSAWGSSKTALEFLESIQREVPENLVDGMRDDRPSGWWALNRSWETGKLTAAWHAAQATVNRVPVLFFPV